MWCKKCKGEYVDGITTCPKCGIALVEEPQIDLEKTQEKPKKNASDNIRETFLVNTSSIVKLAYITSLLNEMKIKYRVLEKDVGQYLSIIHGRNYIGKSVYVEEDRIKDAREVIDSYKAEDLIEDELKSPAEVKKKKVAVFAGVILFVLIGCIFRCYNGLKNNINRIHQ